MSWEANYLGGGGGGRGEYELQEVQLANTKYTKHILSKSSI